MSLLDDLGFKKKTPEERKAEEVYRHISEMEDKREALISALNEEKDRLAKSDDELFKKMGAYVYARVQEMREKGLVNDQLETFLKLLGDNETKRRELDAKVQSVRSRYDEDISILRDSLPEQPSEEIPVPPVAGEKMFCPNCGAPNPTTAAFCSNCGTKLK